MKALEFVLKEALELRIQTFKLRNAQSKLFMEGNDFSIKSLKFKIAKDFESADAFHQQAIDAREDAKKAAEECERLLDKSKELEHAYYRIVEYFEGKKIA